MPREVFHPLLREKLTISSIVHLYRGLRLCNSVVATFRQSEHLENDEQPLPWSAERVRDDCHAVDVGTECFRVAKCRACPYPLRGLRPKAMSTHTLVGIEGAARLWIPGEELARGALVQMVDRNIIKSSQFLHGQGREGVDSYSTAP